MVAQRSGGAGAQHRGLRLRRRFGGARGAAGAAGAMRAAGARRRCIERSWPPTPRLQRQLHARAGRGQATVLTPHPLEAARLLDTDVAAVQADRLLAARQLSRRHACVVLLKGSGTHRRIARRRRPASTPPATRCWPAAAPVTCLPAGSAACGRSLPLPAAARQAARQAALAAAWLHGHAADRWLAQRAGKPGAACRRTERAHARGGRGSANSRLAGLSRRRHALSAACASASCGPACCARPSPAPSRRPPSSCRPCDARPPCRRDPRPSPQAAHRSR